MLPSPSSTDYQEVHRLAAKAPAELAEHTETHHGNRLLYFETPIPDSGEFEVDLPYEVVRREVLEAEPLEGAAAENLSDTDKLQFLAADALVPTSGKPVAMLKALELPMDARNLARQLYDLVDAHVVYQKEGAGWGRGDSNWVCASGYGNCTDFHSLFISLARSQEAWQRRRGASDIL